MLRLKWNFRNVRTGNGYNLIKYIKSPRAVACHVYRPLFLRATTSSGAAPTGCSMRPEYLVAAVDRTGGKRGKGAKMGVREKVQGREGEGVSSCRGGSRNLLAPDALSRGASL